MQTECPAKLNLFLSVGPLEPAGYHQIRSVLQAVNLSDTLVVQRSSRESFECNLAGLQTDNSVIKAVRLAREYVSFPDCAFTLTKRIPSQAGLGGGSSDAAGAIRLVAQLSRGQLGMREQLEIAMAVGMDVPFFLHGGRARVSGFGERVEHLEGMDPRTFVVVMPDAGVETKGAYGRLDARSRPFLQFEDDLIRLHNDFLEVAPEASHLALEGLVSAGASDVSLTGSGAAVFAAFEDVHKAQSVHAKIGWGQSWVCEPLTREQSTWIS